MAPMAPSAQTTQTPAAQAGGGIGVPGTRNPGKLGKVSHPNPEIAALYAIGMGATEIARTLHIGRATVYRHIVQSVDGRDRAAHQAKETEAVVRVVRDNPLASLTQLFSGAKEADRVKHLLAESPEGQAILSERRIVRQYQKEARSAAKLYGQAIGKVKAKYRPELDWVLGQIAQFPADQRGGAPSNMRPLAALVHGEAIVTIGERPEKPAKQKRRTRKGAKSKGPTKPPKMVPLPLPSAAGAELPKGERLVYSEGEVVKRRRTIQQLHAELARVRTRVATECSPAWDTLAEDIQGLLDKIGSDTTLGRVAKAKLTQWLKMVETPMKAPAYHKANPRAEDLADRTTVLDEYQAEADADADATLKALPARDRLKAEATQHLKTQIVLRRAKVARYEDQLVLHDSDSKEYAALAAAATALRG